VIAVTRACKDRRMDQDTLIATLRSRGVSRVCRECGMGEVGGSTTVDLVGGTFLGLWCGHCGHLRLFHEGTLEAPHD
jgi:hypothetical protein